MTFCNTLFYPYIIWQLVLPDFLLSLFHPLLSIPSSQIWPLCFLGPKYYNCLQSCPPEIVPFHNPPECSISMQAGWGWAVSMSNVLSWFSVSCKIQPELLGPVNKVSHDLASATSLISYTALVVEFFVIGLFVCVTAISGKSEPHLLLNNFCPFLKTQLGWIGCVQKTKNKKQSSFPLPTQAQYWTSSPSQESYLIQFCIRKIY